jgi:diacylglycerol kinase (CTP)
VVTAADQSRLHLRRDLHLTRKLWHMSMGVVILAIFMSGISKQLSMMLLGGFFVFFLAIETARLRNPLLNQLTVRLMGPLMRSHEVHRLSGTPYYLAAALVSVAIFPTPITVLSLLYLALGDPVASLFGILYGDKSIRFSNGKSLVGTAAGVGVCALVTLVYLSGMRMDLGTVLLMTVVGGLAGGTAEMLPFEIDDNFTIPIVSGFVLWLSFIIFSIPLR